MFKIALFFTVFGYMAADGLSDLRAALNRYDAKTTISGNLEVQTWSKQGKEGIESRGRANVHVEYGPQGLKMHWSRNFLQQLDKETRARADNQPPAEQALNATWAMEMRKTNSLLNPVAELLRTLETAKLLSEVPERFNGIQARALVFSTPLTGESQRFRRWLKDFESTVKIWIDSDGRPLGITQRTNIKARAFIFISMEQTREETITYANLGDHLVAIRQEEKQEFQGGGEYGSSRTIRTFKLQ